MSTVFSQQLLVSIVFTFVLTACQGTKNRANTNSLSEQLLPNCSADIQGFRSLVNQEGVKR